jgi:hypothetical protein
MVAGSNLSSYDGHSLLLRPGAGYTLTRLEGPGGEVWFGVEASFRDCSVAAASGMPRLCVAALEVQLNSHKLLIEARPEKGKVKFELYFFYLFQFPSLEIRSIISL